MTVDDIRDAVEAGKCSWKDVTAALAAIGILESDQRRIIEGEVPVPGFAAVALWRVLEGRSWY